MAPKPIVTYRATGRKALGRGAGQPSGRWARPKHWVPTRGLRRRDLLLHHVPVLDNSPIGNSEDVDGDHRLWAPARVAAMHPRRPLRPGCRRQIAILTAIF